MELNKTQELIAALAAGEMIILMDDEDRENEGDLVMAAEHVDAEAVNFMVREARGLLCLSLTSDHCQRLGLGLMVNNNQSAHRTNFTVSIEASSGVSTGISAADRACTIRSAAHPAARPSDLVQPGHIFPIMAADGGVLTRAGHTEASVDLARLAGLTPAAAIIEIMAADGSMARRQQLEQFALQHRLKIGTIADLIAYRCCHEQTVHRLSERDFTTGKWGRWRLCVYSDLHANQHLALHRGQLLGSEPVVRVHIVDACKDLLLTGTGGASWDFFSAMDELAGHREAVMVLLAGQSMFNPNEDGGAHSSASYQSIGTGAQILRDLGVEQMQLLSSPASFTALSGFNLEITRLISPDDLLN